MELEEEPFDRENCKCYEA
uniref:Uncharacterized protein n=1 Tax=Moniliophthora roreri TaxID=221103 RepID=A0A0W0FNN9_MONRR